MFSIRTGLNADPDSAFYLIADPDPGHHKKLDFDMKNILYVGTGTKVYGMSLLLRGYKGHFERLKIRFHCLFWSIFLIKDGIPNTDPDPGSQINADPDSKHCLKKYEYSKAGLTLTYKLKLTLLQFYPVPRSRCNPPPPALSSVKIKTMLCLVP